MGNGLSLSISPSMKVFLQSKIPIGKRGPFSETVTGACMISNSSEKNNSNDNKKRTKGLSMYKRMRY